MGGTREWVGVDDIQSRIQMAAMLLDACTTTGHTSWVVPAELGCACTLVCCVTYHYN
jgi:hypothetical protein